MTISNIKHTIDEVRKLLDSKNLIEWDGIYKNNKTYLNCKCKFCRNNCTPTYNDLQRGHSGCKICANQNAGKNRRNSIKAIQELLKEKNLIWIDEVYVNNITPLNCICRVCNRNVFPRYNDVIRNQGGCKYCAAKCRTNKTKHSIKEVQKLLKEKNLIWIDEVYINALTPLNCICKTCGNKCYPKYNNLSQKQNGCLFCGNLNSVKHSSKSYIMTHWKTGVELVCHALWEKYVIAWLNKNHREYAWQSKIFITTLKTKTGKCSTYRPDLYLINENKWIEVKGYFRGDAKEKWEWFHQEYPNSELWDKNKLTEMGLI